MKRVFITLTVILIALILVTFVLVYEKEKGIESNLKMPIEELYKFEPLNKNLSINRARKLVILFSPECDLCEEEFLSIDKNFEKIPEIQIILLSPFPRIVVENFVKKYNFCKSAGTTILLGNQISLNKMFDQYSFPTLFVMDENNHVNRRFNNVVSFDAIYRELQATH
jgi:thioredoxin-related protein